MRFNDPIAAVICAAAFLWLWVWHFAAAAWFCDRFMGGGFRWRGRPVASYGRTILKNWLRAASILLCIVVTLWVLGLVRPSEI